MEEILQKAASEFTKQRQIDFLKEECLDWNNRDDFDNAEKGFIGKDSPAIIYDDAGMAVQDMELYHRILHEVDECPDTVNPSLWRHSLLNDYVGLFKVTEKVYQVRGYDLSNLTVVVGETGYIILDTLLKVETAKAAMKLIYKLLGEKPIKAIVIGHSHTDHFGGVLGVLETRVNLDEQIPIIVPEYFEEAALGENVLAGIAMTRRGAYQFGFTLPTGHTGVIDSGLGKRGPRGTTSFVFATDYIRKTGEKRIIDGVEMIFQMAPESEAPASMHIYLDIAKRPDIILCTGHGRAAEVDAVVTKAVELGVSKICVNHPHFLVNATYEQMTKWAEMGAYIELNAAVFSSIAASGKCSDEVIGEILKAVPKNRIVLDSDLGQKVNVAPVEGMYQFICKLVDEFGVTEDEINLMGKEIPSMLLGI